MPNRILREGILTSPRMARLGWAEEVFYRRLMSIVDDFGRYYADAGLLHAACYPRQLNKVSDSDIEKWLTACVTAALVRVYPAQDGERYLQLLDFGQQVRAKKSRFPDSLSTCAADAEHQQANAPVVVSVVVSESVDVSPDQPATSTRRKAKHPIPENFAVSERVRAWAAEKGFGHLDQHREAFVRKATAKDYRYTDWDLAFMEAIREDWAKLRGRAANGGPAAGESATVSSSAADKTREYLDSRDMTPEQQTKAREAAAAALARLGRGRTIQ